MIKVTFYLEDSLFEWTLKPEPLVEPLRRKPKTLSFNLIMFGTSRNRSVTLTHRGRTYARSSGRTLLSVVQTYDGGPSDVRSVNSTPDVRGTTKRMLLFGIPFG
jgi:hypothetical protein